MREIRLFRSYTFYDRDGFIQTEMGSVRSTSQGIQDQHVESLQKGPACIGNPIGIGAVGDVAEAKPQYVKAGTVFQADWDQPPT